MLFIQVYAFLRGSFVSFICIRGSINIIIINNTAFVNCYPLSVHTVTPNTQDTKVKKTLTWIRTSSGIEIEGYLYKRTSNAFKSWVRLVPVQCSGVCTMLCLIVIPVY